MTFASAPIVNDFKTVVKMSNVSKLDKHIFWAICDKRRKKKTMSLWSLERGERSIVDPGLQQSHFIQCPHSVFSHPYYFGILSLSCFLVPCPCSIIMFAQFSCFLKITKSKTSVQCVCPVYKFWTTPIWVSIQFWN